MSHRLTGLIVLCTALGLATSALAQPNTGGTITDGDVSFTQGNSPTIATGAGATGASINSMSAGPDHLFQTWWWYRVDGTDTREFCFANASSGNWSGNVGTMNFSLPSFDAVMTYTIEDAGDNMAVLTQDLDITNTTGNALNLAIFNYLDVDLSNTIGDDSAAAISSTEMEISDPSNFARYAGIGADGYQVGIYATVRNDLTNSSVSNFTGTGLPFGPADFTGAYQWNESIPSGGSVTVTAVLTINTTVPSGCDGDIDGDGDTDFQDLVAFLADYGCTSSCVGDIDGDGDTDFQDLVAFLADYGCN